MSNDGVGPRAVLRSVAFLTAGALAACALAACSVDDEQQSKPVAAQDIAPAARPAVADGGSLRWAVDAAPGTLNTFQADADAATARIAGAVLPSLFRLDARGRPQRDADFLESAEVVSTEPKQVVVYRLDRQAVWSNGRKIGADDFAAQWRALAGKNNAYWTARNAGYDRIEKVARGANNLEVKVTFGKPYADWRSLFSPLYPKDVTGTPDSFNDGARHGLKVTAGPFSVAKVDKKAGEVVLARNPRWWGRPAKLSQLVLVAVPRGRRAAALADGSVDMAEVEPEDAERMSRGKSGRLPLPGFVIRASLEPAYTQLALNGSRGPLADERVRRAVARALDRTELAGLVLKPLGLPAVPVGSHLALPGQDDYQDNSGALGTHDTAQAMALLTEAGWVPGGPVRAQPDKKKNAAGSQGHRAAPGHGTGDDGAHAAGEDDKPPARHDGDRADKPVDEQAGQHLDHPGGASGAYAPKGTAAPGGAASGMLAKDGKALRLQFVLPSGPDSKTLRMVGDRIAWMLQRVGIRTEITTVPDDSYFKDHIASGDYDLALYSWPATPFPATDARPIFAKPVPAADGSLSVEQNYPRVGTDQVDQLFDQAIATLDEDEERNLVRKADARIWATAASLPLYQRPQLTATRENLANAGSFGFQTPVYEDMGYLKKGAKPSPSPSS